MRKKSAQAAHLITSTLTLGAFARIGDSVLDEEPCKMTAQIAMHYTAPITRAVHEGLRVRSEGLHTRDNIDEYIESHLNLRKKMALAIYLLVEREATTVVFILRGLASRPTLMPHIPRSCYNRLTASRIPE